MSLKAQQGSLVARKEETNLKRKVDFLQVLVIWPNQGRLLSTKTTSLWLLKIANKTMDVRNWCNIETATCVFSYVKTVSETVLESKWSSVYASHESLR